MLKIHTKTLAGGWTIGWRLLNSQLLWTGNLTTNCIPFLTETGMGNVNCCDSIMLEGRNDSAFRPSPGLVRKPAPQCPLPASQQLKNSSAGRTSYVIPKDKHCEKQKNLVQNARIEPSDRGLNDSQVKDNIGQKLDNGKRRVELPLDFVTDNSPCRKREHFQSIELAKMTDAKFAIKIFENPKSIQSNNSKTPEKIDQSQAIGSAQVSQLLCDYVSYLSCAE